MDGKTIIVTGAGAGIGKATALELGRRGAHVVVGARSEASAQPVVEAITRAGGKAEALAMDLTSLESIRAGLDKFLESHDSVDVLINNVSVDWFGFVDVNGDELAQSDEWFVHTYSPTHRYGCAWVGEDQPVKFSIYDLGYQNSGILTLTITPEPASLAALAALSLFSLRRR